MRWWLLFFITPAFAGDPIKGEALFNNQRLSLCLLCHTKGTLAPTLEGVGTRFTAPELRDIIIDRRIVNPETTMPPFYSTKGIVNSSRKETILTLEQIDDLVSYLKVK